MFCKTNNFSIFGILVMTVLLVANTGCNVNKLKSLPDGDDDLADVEVDGDSDTGIDSSFEKFVVGSNGGTFTSEDGVIIDIPIGAVKENIEIGIKKVSDKDTGDVTPISEVYEYAPAGLTFSKPVYITIPFEETSESSEYTFTNFYWTNKDDSNIFGIISDSVVGQNSATAMVTHFSFGFVGQTSDLPPILLKKWISAEDSLIATNSSNADIFWSISNAGLLLIDTKGTFDDQSDDAFVMHHELTIENWPSDATIKKACSSNTGDSNILWFTTQSELYLFDDNATPNDGTDDTITMLENEDVFSSSRQLKELHCGAENTVWLGTNKGLLRIEINPEATGAEDKFIYDDFNTATTKSSGFRVDGDTDFEAETDEDVLDGDVDTTEAELDTAVDGDDELEVEEESTETYDIADMPASDIRYSALAPNGTVWFSTFVTLDNSYHLFKMVPKTGSETGYTSLDEIPTGTLDTTDGEVQFNFVPKAMTVDGSSTLWFSNEFNSKGFPVFYDEDNKSFVAIPFSDKDNVTGMIPAGTNSVILVESNGDDFFLADSENDSAIGFEDFGINDSTNRLTSISYLSGKLLYSSQLDFAMLAIDETSFDGTFTRQRYIAPAGVPFNEIVSFNQTDSATFIGGTNAVSMLNYDVGKFPVEYTANATVIEKTNEVAPFNIQSLSPLKGGMLVGGASLGFLDSKMKFHLWDNPQTPHSVSYAVADPDNNIWVNTTVIDLITLVSMRLYDFNDTETNSSDDSAAIISNATLGLESSAPLLSAVFYEHCRGLFANTLGLHYYDCNQTPDNSGDDILEDKIISSSVSQIVEAEEDMSYWLVSFDGLTYIKFETLPPEKNTDDTYKYEHISFKYSGMSSTFAYDNTTGYLYYFVKDGLVIHDPKGTPLDNTDDEVALFEMASSRNAKIYIDNQGSLWFSYGDKSGVYHAIFNDPEFKPIADVLE